MSSVIIKDLSYIITMDKELRVLRNKSLFIDGGKIRDIGDYADLVRRYGVADEIIDGKGKAALPGLIDAHTHVVMVAMKGLVADLGDVIYSVYWPIEKLLTPDKVRALARLGILEAIKSGITTIFDHYFFAEEIAKAAEELGIRAFIGHTVMSWGGPWVGDSELNEALSFFKRWYGRSDTVKPVLAPHSPETVSPSWLEYIRDIAREYNALIHMHLSQTQKEVEDVKRRTGYTPVRLLNKLGLLNNNLLAVHVVFVDEEELRMIASSGTIVAQTPSTYLLDGTPYHAYTLMRLGGKVVLGTDAPCYSDGIDMFREMRNLIYTQRLLNRNPTIINAREVLSIATISAAKALNIHELGCLCRGYIADVTLIDLRKPKFTPIHDAISSIVYTATASDVSDVIINGKVLVKEGRYVHADEGKMMSEAEKVSKDLILSAINENPKLKALLKV